MKTIKALLLAAVLVMAGAVPASAQFRWGPRIGTQVSSMSLDKEVFKSENRAGLTVGLTGEVTVPIIGICADASIMYVHRVNSAKFKADNGATEDEGEALGRSSFRQRDYIEIPVNLKYKFGLPVVGRFVAPFLQTGPSFSVLASKKNIGDGFKNRRFSTSWNFGAGVELLHKVQISASYSLGMNNTIEYDGNNDQPHPTKFKSKNHYWTITAAWFF